MSNEFKILFAMLKRGIGRVEGDNMPLRELYGFLKGAVERISGED